MEDDEKPLLDNQDQINQIKNEEQILLTGEDLIRDSSLRSKKVKIYLDTHISVKYKIHQPTELFDEIMHLDKNSQILVYLSSSFLANPFDTLADLSQAFGTPSILSMDKEKDQKEYKELTIKISIENAWG